MCAVFRNLFLTTMLLLLHAQAWHSLCKSIHIHGIQQMILSKSTYNFNHFKAWHSRVSAQGPAVITWQLCEPQTLQFSVLNPNLPLSHLINDDEICSTFLNGEGFCILVLCTIT